MDNKTKQITSKNTRPGVLCMFWRTIKAALEKTDNVHHGQDNATKGE